MEVSLGIKNMGVLKTLKGKLILTYVLIATVPILFLSILTYYVNRNIMVNKISKMSNNYSIQSKITLNNYLSQIEYYITYICR